ncbi:MAG: hypothetical protein GF347_01050 [Candidatus Moranbacteria bacterium]|nr:hypothetical protein [Candidatus Moranbacteria bacterium]
MTKKIKNKNRNPLGIILIIFTIFILYLSQVIYSHFQEKNKARIYLIQETEALENLMQKLNNIQIKESYTPKKLFTWNQFQFEPKITVQKINEIRSALKIAQNKEISQNKHTAQLEKNFQAEYKKIENWLDRYSVLKNYEMQLLNESEDLTEELIEYKTLQINNNLKDREELQEIMEAINSSAAKTFKKIEQGQIDPKFKKTNELTQTIAENYQNSSKNILESLKSHNQISLNQNLVRFEKIILNSPEIPIIANFLQTRENESIRELQGIKQNCEKLKTELEDNKIKLKIN